LAAEQVAHPRFTRSFAFALLLALITMMLAAPAQSAQVGPPYQLSLPVLGNGGPRGLLGVETSAITASRDVAGLVAMGPGWVRRSGLRWADVQPTAASGYRWDAPSVQALDAELRTAAQQDLRVVMTIHGSPAWAVDPFGVDCAPINPAYYGEFARFLAAAVQRYSAPPYNIHHWEIGNEPDAFVFTSDSPFGCWGRPQEELYGGQAYGDMLKRVYPAIKQADPSAQVLLGGLLLEAPYDPNTGQGRSGRFLEGVLSAGAGNSFDILAYHSYSYYDGTPDGTAGTQDWKPAYLRALLTRYGLDKPLFNTEGALLCLQPSAACAEAQAHAMGRLYVRGLRDNLMGLIWYLYDSDSFRSTALVDPTTPTQHRAAYAAFAQAASALSGYQYAEPVAGLPAGVEAHRLVMGDRSTIVLWSNTPTAITLQIGDGVSPRCTAWNGSGSPCSAAAGALPLEVGPSPLYVRLDPS
jgi:hypothetical protein